MFVSRKADITFSNISLIVDGKEVFGVEADIPEENPTEKPSETPTEKPSEEPTQKPSEEPSEEPTEKPSEEPSEAPTEKPSETPTEAPTQQIVTTDRPSTEVSINQQFDTDSINKVLDKVATGEAVKVNVNKSEVSIEADVFKQAAEKDVELIFDCGRYAWKFTDLSADNAVEVKSLKVDINANVPAVEEILGGADVDNDTRRTVSFEHEGELPGKAEVTINVAEKFSNGKELYLYYFNEVSKGFEFISKNVVSGGNVTIELTHCSDYVLTENELPAELVVVTSSGSDANLDVETGDASPIMIYVVLAVLSMMVLACFEVYDKKKKSNR